MVSRSMKIIFDLFTAYISRFLSKLFAHVHDVVFASCRDTAGQERYQTITKQYYRRAQVRA